MSLYERIRSGEAAISLVGLGYVGMPLAVAFAAKGVQAPALRVVNEQQ